MTELGNISERRIDRLVNPPARTGLPQFLIVGNGLNSGFMLVHVTAAALTSENRTLSHPATVDNIPTSANQEDHVSMGTIAARKTREIVRNCKHILAIELMAAMQALDFHDHPSSKIIETIKKTVRRQVPFLAEDSRMDVPLDRMVRMIESGALLAPFVRARFRLR
jgi:histidine ammonia-lyase